MDTIRQFLVHSCQLFGMRYTHRMQFPHLGFTRIYRVDPDGSIFLTCPHESTGLTCPTRERLREFTKDGSRSPTCPHESTDPTCPTRDPLTSLLMTEIRGLWSQLESTGFILLFFSEIVHITSYNSFSILLLCCTHLAVKKSYRVCKF